MKKIVPEKVRLAAKRAFVRTTAQAYSTALAGGISAATLLGLYEGEVPLVPTLITVGVVVVSPVLAGAASYFSMISKGVPEEYTESDN